MRFSRIFYVEEFWNYPWMGGEALEYENRDIGR